MPAVSPNRTGVAEGGGRWQMPASPGFPMMIFHLPCRKDVAQPCVGEQALLPSAEMLIGGSYTPCQQRMRHTM